MTYPWLEAVETEFVERLGNGRLPHALLLSGPRNTGKTGLAHEFAASLLCLEGQYPACGSCRSCQLLVSGAHPDRHLITFEENPKTGEMRKELVIGQVRKLIGSLCLTNTMSTRKVALVYPVEAMNRHTANALLKTLEEPPGDSVLILVSHDTARLPATIRSRCQNLQVRTPEPVSTREWLCREAACEPAEAETALLAAAGSPLGALGMLRDGSTDQYRQVLSAIADLRAGATNPASAIGLFSEVDPQRLWSWLSLLAAQELKKAIDSPVTAKSLSVLQTAADRNRELLSTPLRKDFLLQDWLIQWSRLGTR